MNIAIPSNIRAVPGGIINVPVAITDSADGAFGFNVNIQFDPAALSLTPGSDVPGWTGFNSPDVQLGALFENAEGWSITSYFDAGKLGVCLSRISPMLGGVGAILNLRFKVAAGFSGVSALKLSGLAEDAGQKFTFQSGSITTATNGPETDPLIEVRGTRASGKVEVWRP